MLVIFLIIILLSICVYGARSPPCGVGDYHGVQICGFCYDCGISDGVCPEIYGADCLIRDDDCCAVFVNGCDDYKVSEEQCVRNLCNFNLPDECEWFNNKCQDSGFVECNNNGVKEIEFGERCDKDLSGVIDFGDGKTEWLCSDYNPEWYESGFLGCSDCMIDFSGCSFKPGVADSCSFFETLGACNAGEAGSEKCYWDADGGLFSSVAFCDECSSSPECDDYTDSVTCEGAVFGDPCDVLCEKSWKCSWDSVNLKCAGDDVFSLASCFCGTGDSRCDDSGFNNLPPDLDCVCDDVSYSKKCENGKRMKQGLCTGPDAATCDAGLENHIGCAKPKKFPVFDNINILIVVLLLLGYYVYFIGRKRK